MLSRIKHCLETNTLHVSIEVPYYTVGTQLGWDTAAGLGLEPGVIQRVLEKEMMLSVYVVKENKTYWVNHDILHDWLLRHEFKGENNGRSIGYIEMAIFMPLRPGVV